MATPTTLAELAPFWRADDNEGVSLESVSKEIAAYKPGGTFAEDYAAFVQLLQVVAHPKVGAVAIAKPGDKAEGDEGEEKAENSRVGVRNHVVDVGTAKCLSCAPPAHRTRGRRRTRAARAGVLPLHLTVTELVFYNCGMGLGAVGLAATVAVEYNPLPRAEAPAPDAEAPGDEAAPAPDPACVFAWFLAENVPRVSLRGDGPATAARAPSRTRSRATRGSSRSTSSTTASATPGGAVVGAARYNTMLKTLSLSNNACGDGTAAAAAATLVGGPVDDAATAGRHKRANFPTSKAPIAAMFHSLPPNVEEVPPLEPLVSAGGADYARGNKALEILNLSNNKISDDGARAALAAFAAPALSRRARAGGRARDAGEPVDGLDFKLAAAVREVNLTRAASTTTSASSASETRRPLRGGRR
ncbi:hypothetical protein JL720_5941 [Aureococcus anophagefferens]|nr:hypothetical protein JL720_5941 [Aureococcus anophagefferens]